MDSILDTVLIEQVSGSLTEKETVFTILAVEIVIMEVAHSLLLQNLVLVDLVMLNKTWDITFKNVRKRI